MVAEHIGEECEEVGDRKKWLRGQELLEHFRAWMNVYTEPSGEPAILRTWMLRLTSSSAARTWHSQIRLCISVES